MPERILVPLLGGVSVPFPSFGSFLGVCPGVVSFSSAFRAIAVCGPLGTPVVVVVVWAPLLVSMVSSLLWLAVAFAVIALLSGSLPGVVLFGRAVARVVPVSVAVVALAVLLSVR